MTWLDTSRGGQDGLAVDGRGPGTPTGVSVAGGCRELLLVSGDAQALLEYFMSFSL